jgi:ubiquitin-associated SH3 domain-containing protein
VNEQTDLVGALGARRELILYATPTGELAESIDRYFAEVDASAGTTTAQTYPPHCTLTGFFRRSHAGAEAAIAAMGRGIDAAGPVPDDAVEVVGLTATEEWVGLELRSPWLLSLTAAFAAEDRPEPGDEALRLKDWLHLSLAYGVDELDAHTALANQLVDPTRPAGWEVAVWERRANAHWIRHTASLPAHE